jgi:hypothetical protein
MRKFKKVRFQGEQQDAHYGYITATGCLYSTIGTVRLANENDGTVTINGQTFKVEFAR